MHSGRVVSTLAPEQDGCELNPWASLFCEEFASPQHVTVGCGFSQGSPASFCLLKTCMFRRIGEWKRVWMVVCQCLAKQKKIKEYLSTRHNCKYSYKSGWHVYSWVYSGRFSVTSNGHQIPVSVCTGQKCNKCWRKTMQVWLMISYLQHELIRMYCHLLILFYNFIQ